MRASRIGCGKSPLNLRPHELKALRLKAMA
jgi:hypothetical protein